MDQLAHHGFHVVVVGGGIAGLSTAWYLQEEARRRVLDLRYTVLEQSGRWGGKILTERIDGFVVEGGPDSFITQKPWALQLARELGLEACLLGTNDHLRRTYVVHKGRPTPLPEGVLLVVPTRLMPFVRSSLISPLGKLRMGLEWFIPPRRDDEDETLAQFISRRLGREALDKIAEPLLSGIYNAEAERQSVLATFPRFRELERRYGSLTRGMLATRRAKRAAHSAHSKAQLSMFMSLQGGTCEMVEALVTRLTGDLRLNTAVEHLRPLNDGGYELGLSDGSVMQADVVVLATPAYVSADLLAELAPQAAAGLAAIRYVSTGTISLAFRRSDVPNLLEGFGLVVPRSERRPINAITISSTKFERRAPEGYVLLRVFFGGSRSPQSMKLDDAQLLAVVRSELQLLLGISAQPLFYRIYRWHRSNPQYDVGHLQRIAAIRAALPVGIYVTGSAYQGVGIPDCVRQGRETAQAVVEHLMLPPRSVVNASLSG